MLRTSLVTLAALAGLSLGSAATPAAAATIYDNTLGPPVAATSAGVEIGDQVTVAGTARLVTTFTFIYYWPDIFSDGDETVTLRFYSNDGAGGAPGTLLFESAPLPLPSVPVTPPFSLTPFTLTDLAIVVPDTFTWTLEWGNTPSFSSPALFHFDPPTVGSSDDFFWLRQGPLFKVETGFPDNLGVTILAVVPQPSTLGLLVSAVIAAAVVATKRRRPV
jgi:hypothetical protein